MASSVARDSLWTFVVNVLKMLGGLLMGIYVARWLGPAGKGLISGLDLMRGVISCLTAGFGASVTHLLTKKGQPLAVLIRPLGVVAAIVTVICWTALGLWAWRNGTAPSWVVSFAAVPAAVILSWQTALYTGLNRVKSLNYQTFALTAGTFASLIVARYMFHASTLGILVAWIIPWYIAAAYLVMQVVVSARHGPRMSLRAELHELAAVGLRWSVFPVMGFLIYRLDSLLVASLLGAAAFGIYSVAVGGSELLYMISRSTATASTFRVGSGSLALSGETTAKAIRVSALAVFVAAAVLFFAGPPLIHVIYGQRFDGAWLPLRILLPGIIAYSSAGIFASFFLYQLGRPAVITYLTIFLLVLQSALCFALIPRLGLAGAAISSSATYLADAVVETWYFCRITRLSAAKVWIPHASDVEAVMQLLPFHNHQRSAR